MQGLRGHAISRNALDRGERVIAALAGRGLLRPGDVDAAPMAEMVELSHAHDLTYLESLNDPTVLGRIFGVDAESMVIDLPLYAQRHAVGGTLLAAKTVTECEAHIGINLGGGMHHAHRAQGAGFCPYNDIAVAIARLRASGFEAPIAVVDLDFHQGDGTESIFANDPSVLTYSVHGSQWQDISAVESINVELPPRTRDDAYLEALSNSLPQHLRAHRPGLVFYLAGNDVLADDALGDFSMSPLGVLHRDQRVIEWTRSLGAKLVITLAGGYGDLAWRASMNMVRYVLTGYFRASAEAIDVRRR
ncbi:MAG: histone deacetylase, partial [Myxococcota bacterium]